MPWHDAIHNALRIARKYADGGFLDPKPMSPPQKFRTAPQKSPNQRVGEGHQEFEKGYARGWDWNDGPDYPVGIKNMRGQDLQLRRAADGGGIQRTEPFPEKPEGYEFYGPDDGPGDAPTESVPLPKSRPRQPAEYTAGSEGMLSYDPAQEPPRKGPLAIMEPDLQSAQTGQLPEGLDPEKYMIGEGNIILDRKTWEPVQFTPRPNVLPLTKTPEGEPEFAMPKMLDIIGNMGGGWSVPVRGAEAILGAGMALPRQSPFMPLPKSGLYSAAHEAVQNAPHEKAYGGQWLGYLRNQPGVKAEELNWLGTPEFLQSQRGPVTKEQLAAHVREHQLELKDVGKGGGEVHRFGTAEEQAAALKRYEDGKQAILSSRPGSPEYAQAKEEFAAAESALRDIVPGWGRAEGSGEFIKGGDTKYGSYTLPGGQNYREMLIQMPTPDWYYAGRKDAPSAEAASKLYRSSHWEEPNVLAHVRFNDRTIGGKKTLFIEEVQSDWHQQGRQRGYRQTYKPDELTEVPPNDPLYGNNSGNVILVKAPDNVFQIAKSNRPDRKIETFDDAKKYILENKTKGGGDIPDAPFKTSWPELAMKRILKYAADNGYDQIAWTPGHVQAARYDLSKHIDKITYDGQRLWAWKKDSGTPDINKLVKPEELADTIGKEAAERLMRQPEKTISAFQPNGPRSYRTLEGADLKIGGEGMNKFYDEILPATANKIGKKFGARVRKGALATGDVSRFDIEPSGNGWRVVDREQNEGTGTFIGPVFRSGADAERWLKERGHTDVAAHVLPITDALKRMAKERGFPLFKRGGKIRGES